MDLLTSGHSQKILEQRLKDLNDVMQNKNVDLKQYQSTIEAIEILQKKAKQDYDKIKKDRDDIKKQMNSLKPEYDEKMQEIDEKLQKNRKELETTKVQNKKFEKERNDAVKKLQENQKLWIEIEQCLEEEEEPKDDDDQSER